MNFERSALRYAHTTGYTSVIYTKDNGEYILSCGNDGDLRKWDSIEDDDPTSNCLGEFVICIAMQHNKIFASTDRNTVQAYKFPEIENDGVLMRFTSFVTCLSVTDHFIAAGSDDTIIKVQRHSDSDASTELSFKHAGPVLALDISPVDPYLASIGGDGELKIWDLNKGTELKSHTGLPKVNSFESASCYGTPTFEPCHGKLLAYATNKEIIVLGTTDWEMQFMLVDDRVAGNYTCCRFSSDGKFLAAGTTSGEISIFNVTQKIAIQCEAPPSDCQSITSLAWKPNSNKELAYCDASGQLGIMFSNKASTTSASAAVLEDAQLGFDDIEFENDDGNEIDKDVGLSGDLYGVNNDDDDGISIEKLKNSILRSANTGDANISGDENTQDSSSTRRSEPVAIVKTFKQQSAFQPSSTPSKLEHRYLVWNDVGIVTAHADEGDGSIDVEFHDASIHHALHISNIDGHDMASLSTSVLALAANNSSKLICITLAAASNKEWSVQFPDCESAEAIVATTQVVAAATSSNFLRVFTVLGTQREIISLPGPVVSLAGFEDRLIVCYHSAPPSETQQYIAAMLIQFRGLSLRSLQIPLPLPAGRQMTWLGFSDCGSPVFADSMGLLQLYSLKGNFWAPICDTMKQTQSVSNNYFIIAVSERQQILQAVLCRGCTYPMTNPRPMMQELSLQMPHCDLESDKAELEDTLVRSSFMALDNQLVKETAIKLFALACRSENEARAKELIETIANPELLMLAVKYASKLGRTHLSERLYELLPKMQQQPNGQEEFTINEPTPISPHKQPTNTPTNTLSAKLAPKTMELSSAKRSTLKRFSATPTIRKSGIDANGRTSEMASSPSLNVLDNNDVDSQENIYSEKLSSTESNEMPKKEFSRNPLNSVNPFAAKRKLEPDSDTGHGKGILLGANKLKIAKK